MGGSRYREQARSYSLRFEQNARTLCSRQKNPEPLSGSGFIFLLIKER
jgi:hypothetical protein